MYFLIGLFSFFKFNLIYIYAFTAFCKPTLNLSTFTDLMIRLFVSLIAFYHNALIAFYHNAPNMEYQFTHFLPDLLSYILSFVSYFHLHCCLFIYQLARAIPDWQSMAENWELWMLFSFLPASLFSLFVTFMRSKLLLTFWDGHRGRGKPIVPDNVTRIAKQGKARYGSDKCQELV